MNADTDQAVRSYKPLTEEFMAGLNRLRDNEDLFDVTVIIGNKPFRAHKLVLASLSGYFQVMFTNPGFTDCNQSEIEIKDETLTPGSFHHLLDFMYSGKVIITDIQNAIELLQLSGFLQITGAIKICVDYLIDITAEEEIPFETAYVLSSIANRLDHPDLKNAVDRYVGQNMLKLSQTAEFLEQMTADYLGELLVKVDLSETTSEEEILEVVVDWLWFNWENRKCHTVTLLQKVRLGVIPNHTVSEVLNDEIKAVAKDIISKDGQSFQQSTHRGTLTKQMNDIDVYFGVVAMYVNKRGFRTISKQEFVLFKNDILQLISNGAYNASDVYPLTAEPPQGFSLEHMNRLQEEEEDIREELNICDASYKVVTNLPKFQVFRNNDKDVPGWRLAKYAEVERFLEIIKPDLSYHRLWYICQLQDGRVAGSGYDFNMQRGDHLTLGHRLLVKYPPHFSISLCGNLVPGWRLAICQEVEDNIHMLKSLLRRKRSQYECLFQGGKITGEQLGFEIQYGTFMGLQYQVLAKMEK